MMSERNRRGRFFISPSLNFIERIMMRGQFLVTGATFLIAFALVNLALVYEFSAFEQTALALAAVLVVIGGLVYAVKE